MNLGPATVASTYPFVLNQSGGSITLGDSSAPNWTGNYLVSATNVDQNISGIKNFISTPTVGGTNLVTTTTTNSISTNLNSTGVSLLATINSTGSTLSTRLNSTGQTLTSNLSTTGVTLNNTINSLSGTLTGFYATIANLNTTGSALVTSINTTNNTINLTGSTLKALVDLNNLYSVKNNADQTITGTVYSRNLLLQGNNVNAYIRPINASSNLFLGANNTDYLLLSSSGNLGVGNTSSTLNFGAGSRSVEIAATTSVGVLRVKTNNTTGDLYASEAAGTILNSNNQLILATTGTERIRVTNNGNIGIGIPNPTATLHINGSENISLSGVAVTDLPSTPLAIAASGNTYVQTNFQNKATGNASSMDIVITTSDGTDSNNYLNIGLNNSGYNQSAYNISSGYDGYFYVNGGNLSIGTQTTSKNLIVHVGGTTSGNKTAEFTATGLNLTTGRLFVNGPVIADSFSLTNISTKLATNTAIGTAAWTDAGVSQTLTSGTWLVSSSMLITGAATATAIGSRIIRNDAGALYGNAFGYRSAVLLDCSTLCISTIISTTSGTTIKLQGYNSAALTSFIVATGGQFGGNEPSTQMSSVRIS
jgi:hypothetical protein